MMEEAFIVSNWVPNLAERFEPEDIAVFRRWINTWISNWAVCDSFCNHTVGDFIEKSPEFIGELKQWTQIGQPLDAAGSRSIIDRTGKTRKVP